MVRSQTRIQSKKAPRPGAFLLPKPKPMRRITLLIQYNGGSRLRLHILFLKFQKKSVNVFLIFQHRLKRFLELFQLGLYNISTVRSVIV